MEAGPSEGALGFARGSYLGSTAFSGQLGGKTRVRPRTPMRKETWMEKVLEAFWKVFSVSAPPPEVEEAVRGGHGVIVWHPAKERSLAVYVRKRGVPLWEGPTIHVPSDRSDSLTQMPAVSVEFEEGAVTANVGSGLFLGEGRAYFRGYYLEEAVTAEEARSLTPLLAAMDLEDLEGALAALTELEDGEARREGRYTLAREGSLRVLWLGELFGDWALDAAFLLGKPAHLSFRKGVRVVLRGHFHGKMLGLEQASVRWGNEMAFVAGGSLRVVCPALEGPLLPRLLRKAFAEMARNEGLSAPLAALVEEAAREEDPAKALNAEEFFRRVHMRALSRM